MDKSEEERFPGKPYAFSFQLSKPDGPQEELIVLPLMAKEPEDTFSLYASDDGASIPGTSRSLDAAGNQARFNETTHDTTDMKGVYQEPSADVYRNPPRQFKFNRQPHRFYWYSTGGSSKLEVPPPFPDGFTLQHDVIFMHRLLDRPEQIQTWWRREGDTTWTTIQQGDIQQFHGITYHLTVSSIGDVSWVLPDTFKKQKRAIAKLQRNYAS